jgi:hypothetical protein
MRKQIPGRPRHPLYELLPIFNFNTAHLLPSLAVPEEFEADDAFQLPGVED